MAVICGHDKKNVNLHKLYKIYKWMLNKWILIHETNRDYHKAYSEMCKKSYLWIHVDSLKRPGFQLK